MDLNITIPEGYKLIAIYKNEVVMAEAENKTASEQYVIWRTNNDTSTCTEENFTTFEDAERYFCGCAFGITYNAVDAMMVSQIKRLSKASELCNNDDLIKFSNAMSELCKALTHLQHL